MATIEVLKLPSGATAQLLVPDRLKAAHQMQMMRAIRSEKTTIGAATVDATCGAIAIVVQSWTAKGDDNEILPIPSEDLDSIGELDPKDFDTLLAHPGIRSTIRRVLEVAAARPVTPDDWADPASPSAASNGAQPPSSTEAVQSAGGPATRGGNSSTSRGTRTGSAGPRKKSGS